MYLGKTLFAQVMDFLPWKTFHRIVDHHGGDHRTRSLSCAEQFRVMAFAQLTYRESLRDIEVCLAAQAGKLYHMGIGEAVARSTLADANESRDWRIYFKLAQRLIVKARALYVGEHFGVELANTASLPLWWSETAPTGTSTDTDRWSWHRGHTRYWPAPRRSPRRRRAREP